MLDLAGRWAVLPRAAWDAAWGSAAQKALEAVCPASCDIPNGPSSALLSCGLLHGSFDRITVWLRLEGAFELICFNPLLKQSHPEQAAHECVQAVFEYLQDDGRLQDLLGQPVPVLTGKTGFLICKGNLLCSSLCPFLLVLSLGTTGERLAPSSLHFHFRYLHTSPPPPPPPQACSFQVLQSFYPWGPSQGSLQSVPVSLLLESPSLGTALLTCWL